MLCVFLNFESITLGLGLFGVRRVVSSITLTLINELHSVELLDYYSVKYYDAVIIYHVKCAAYGCRSWYLSTCGSNTSSFRRRKWRFTHSRRRTQLYGIDGSVQSSGLISYRHSIQNCFRFTCSQAILLTIAEIQQGTTKISRRQISVRDLGTCIEGGGANCPIEERR